MSWTISVHYFLFCSYLMWFDEPISWYIYHTHIEDALGKSLFLSAILQMTISVCNYLKLPINSINWPCHEPMVMLFLIYQSFLISCSHTHTHTHTHLPGGCSVLLVQSAMAICASITQSSTSTSHLWHASQWMCGEANLLILFAFT